MVVEDRERFALDQGMEHGIAAALKATFVESFDWTHYRFYVRRDRLPATPAAPSPTL